MAYWEEIQSNKNFNKCPDNFREITEAGFAKSWFFTYSPKTVEHRQFKFEGKTGSFHMFNFHTGVGFAISNDYWEGKIRYFQYGCDHNWVEISQKQAIEEGIAHMGYQFHVNKCTKCAEIWSYDSSD